ncbi:hypothetical protein HanIR_Chr13g0661561 [Helianthus annuus]|nr:hypothetical protein HanIR_Chr13g0661561 [Helianthus annuus]
MDCGFIKLWRPYSFGGPRPKPHLAYPWADPESRLLIDTPYNTTKAIKIKDSIKSQGSQISN